MFKCAQTFSQSADSVFCTGPRAGDDKSASRILKKKAEDGMQTHSCKDRNGNVGQSVDIELHVFLGQCKFCKSSKYSCWKLGTTLGDSRQDHFREHVQ